MSSFLEEKLKKVINKNYVKVTNTLDPKTMLTHLKETGILTVAGYDTYYEELNNMLTHGKTKQDINIRLLEILYTRDRWWIAFLKALHQCRLQKIIDILEGALSENEVYRLHREIGVDYRSRSNGRPPRSERREYMRNTPPSDSESDRGSLTENAQYQSLPEPRSRRKTSHEVDQEATQQRHFRADCYAAQYAIPKNDLSWTQESNGYVHSGYPQCPEEQDIPSNLYHHQYQQPIPGAVQISVNGSSNPSLYRGSSQPNPTNRPIVRTGVARSSSAPSGPQHSDNLRLSQNPSGAFQGSRERGQGQVSSGQFSPADPVIPTPSGLSYQATETGPRTSGPFDTQAFGPQVDRSTSCNERSSVAPLPRQELIDVSFNTLLRNVPMKLLNLLDRLDHNQKWSELGSNLTDKFLGEDYSKILSSNSEEHKTKQVLDFFKAAEGERATFGRLITALQKMQRQDLLDDIKELTGLTFQDEEDVINEDRRKNSWAGTSNMMVDLDISIPDIKPPNVSSAARADVTDQFEQNSVSSSALHVMDPYKCKDKQSCTGTTEVSQSSFTGTTGMYKSNQVILSQLQEEKKLEEALKCENQRNQNRPVESPNEEHQTEQEHGNPPCLESDFSDENNINQNSSNNADTKPKPELGSKVINTNSSASPNGDTITNMNQQPKLFATPAAASSSPLPISVNAIGTEAEACQHGQAHPPQLSVHINNHSSINATGTEDGACQHGQVVIHHPPQLPVFTNDHSSINATGTEAGACQHGQAHPPQLSVHINNHSSINATGTEDGACQHGQVVIHHPPQLPVFTNDHSSINATGTEAGACQHGQVVIHHPPQLPVFTNDHSSINATGTEAEACQHGHAVIHPPPHLPVHTKDYRYPASEKLSSSFKASNTVSPGHLPNFDKITPISLTSSGTSNTSHSSPGHNIAASNNPNHMLGPDSGVTAGTHPMVGDKTSHDNYVARHETMPKTVANSSDDSIAFTEDANTASKLISGQHSSSVEVTTPTEPTGATGSLGSDLHETSDGSIFYVPTLGSSILDETQRSTYQENNQNIGEIHILTMSEASVCPSFIAEHEKKVLQQSMYYERVPVTKGCAEDDFLSLGESEEEGGGFASGHTGVKENSYQGQGRFGAEESRGINEKPTVDDVMETADSRSSTSAADGTRVTSSAASLPLKGATASTTSGCTSAADGDTSTKTAGTLGNASRGTSFSRVISSGLQLLKLLTIATDVNTFYST
ncbi:serine-rich adhesin for platelets-like isoform X2 [Haliotis asinina]